MARLFSREVFRSIKEYMNAYTIPQFTPRILPMIQGLDEDLLGAKIRLDFGANLLYFMIIAGDYS